jgi:hypothetical protein
MSFLRAKRVGCRDVLDYVDRPKRQASWGCRDVLDYVDRPKRQAS